MKFLVKEYEEFLIEFSISYEMLVSKAFLS